MNYLNVFKKINEINNNNNNNLTFLFNFLKM